MSNVIIDSLLILSLMSAEGRYQVLYSIERMQPIQVAWLLSDSDLGRVRRDPSYRFVPDDRCPEPRSTPEDYTRSGYDRGHHIPAADRSASISSMKSTFLMSNISPQAPRLNRGAWKKVEDACRRMARNGHRLAIRSMPVFWPAPVQDIGRNRIPVPHGFVKEVRLADTDSIIFAKYYCNGN